MAVDYTVLSVEFHYNSTDSAGQFQPTTSSYTLKYSQLLRGNWHTSVIQDLNRDVSFEPNESLIGNERLSTLFLVFESSFILALPVYALLTVIDYITKEMTRLGFHPHVINHQVSSIID